MNFYSLPNLTGTNLKHTKAYNVRIVLETIRIRAPISRADIARLTELTPQTVSNIVGELVEYDLVQEVSLKREGRGAPSVLLKINPDITYSIGLDLDRDHLTGVLLDLEGTLRGRRHLELNFPTPEDALDLMQQMAHELLDEAGLEKSQISGVGVGIPGPLNITDESRVSNAVSPENFPGWLNIPIADRLQERLSLPIRLENNASAAAIGERWYGAGKGISSFFYFYFGAGLGGGLIINGRPYCGATGNAGEVGYLPTSFFKAAMDTFPAGEQPPIIGEPFHLPHLYEELKRNGAEASVPADLDKLFIDGNDQLHAWTGRAIQLLTPLVIMVESVVDPAAFFIGGRLPASLTNAILEGLKEELSHYSLPGKTTTPSLLQATAGENAAALGVATLPVYELFAPTNGSHAKLTSGKDGNSLAAIRLPR